MLNPLDTHAAADRSDAEDQAYDSAWTTIATLDGKTLFESGAVDVDALLDAFNLPGVFVDTTCGCTDWDSLGPGEQNRWEQLAAVIRWFGYDRLDEDLAAGHADQLAA